MAKTFTSGDVLTAADLNNNVVQRGGVGTPGFKVFAGTTAYSMAAVTATTISCDYTAASLSTLIAFTCTATAGSSNRIDTTINGNPTTTTASVIVRQSENVAASTSGNCHWVVFGT